MARISDRKPSLSKKEESFLPWFLTLGLRKKVEKLLPRYYHFRLRLYYQTYGCIACKRKDRLYGSNGLCQACSMTVGDRLRQTDAKLQRQFGRDQDGAAELFLHRLESAKALLGDLKGIMGPPEAAKSKLFNR